LSGDRIDYGTLQQQALRHVVRWALERAAQPEGLPGAHHFFLTFDTRAPGVRIPDFLAKRYPEEMTVVLKRHYRDLTVSDEGFSVGLWFDGREAEVGVPWDALRQFVDPAASFVLRFESDPRSPALQLRLSPPRDASSEAASSEAEVVSLADFRKKHDDDV